MKSLCSLTTFVVALLGVSGTCRAQSLWEHRVPPYAKLIFDTQARYVGDTVTVVIRETTDVDNRDQRQMDRDVESDGGFNLMYALTGQFGDKDASASLDVSTDGHGMFDGQSQYRVERDFADRITATVVRCLPNGNLVIHGTRNRVVSGERRALVISGVIRPLDILPDNTIESQFVANFRVCYAGDGVESRFTRRGWLTKAWDKFRPH